MFGGGGSIQLARILGIRIGVSASWFLVLFLFIFLLSDSFKAVLDSSDTVAYVTAVASVLLFFASLVAHELGHALAARRIGIKVLGIDLWFFGGIAKLDRDTDSPGAEFQVAIAGPLVTLLIVVLCSGLGVLVEGGSDFYDAAVLDSAANTSPVLLLLSWLATINTALLVFNLIPAFPLDGGRVARAIAWKVTGSRNRATRIAGSLGLGFAYLMIGVGIFLALTGSVGNGIWTLVLGWFLLQAARGAVAQTAFSERIEGITVADVMDQEPVVIPATTTAERALDEWVLRYRWSWFAVVDDDGRFAGIVRQERIEGAVHAGDGSRPVGVLVDAETLTDWRVPAGDPLETLLGNEPLRRNGALMAVDEGGVLRGVVTVEQVRRALSAALGSGARA